MLFGIWQALKRLRLVGGKMKLFSDKMGEFNCGILEDLKDISAAGMLVDKAHQRMIIP
jgi:hypothetical protein